MLRRNVCAIRSETRTKYVIAICGRKWKFWVLNLAELKLTTGICCINNDPNKFRVQNSISIHWNSEVDGTAILAAVSNC